MKKKKVGENNILNVQTLYLVLVRITILNFFYSYKKYFALQKILPA